MPNFLKSEIITKAISSNRQHCVGYLGQGGYLTALIMGFGSFPKTFSHKGSEVLDSVLAYDRAEVEDIYLGQINMSLVSSFSGPEGLIWGYDCARKAEEAWSPKSIKLPADVQEVGLRRGSVLRDAARALLGTNAKRHFPFLPGSHVFCAGKFRFFWGPTRLYAAVGIGIPEDRSNAACVFMEDVGQILAEEAYKEEEIMVHMAQSVVNVGRNQRVSYREVFVDCITKTIPVSELGCALVAMPYFHLAKNAYNENILEQSLDEWTNTQKLYFLE